MSKVGMFLISLVWLAGSTYAGYRLAEYSFSWTDAPATGASGSAQIQLPSIGGTLEAVKGKLPQPGQDPAAWFNSLPKITQDCLRNSVTAERLNSALKSGSIQPTPAEAMKIAACLAK